MKLNDYSGDSIILLIHLPCLPIANQHYYARHSHEITIRRTIFLSQLLFGFIVSCADTIFIMPVHCVLAEAAEFTVANGELSLAAPAG